MTTELTCLLQAPPAVDPVEDVEAWARGWRTLAAEVHEPVALALRGGFAADRLGWAFASGYQAALRALPVPRPAGGTIFGLSVTEAGGNRPRDIAAQLQRGSEGAWRLEGRKRWATLAPVADALLVIARDGAVDAATDPARPALTAVWLPRTAGGLSVRSMPATPFVPEVPHAELEFDGIVLDDAARVPGDAYAAIVKPFRTIEDLFVALGTLAWLLREARARGWPRTLVERIAALIEALVALAHRGADDAATHVALAGALALAASVHTEIDELWTGDDAAARRWRADRGLFTVAGEARRLRLERAWQRLGRAAAA